MNVNIISILGRRKLRPRIEIILTSSLVVVLLHQNIFVTKTSRMDSEFAMRFFHLIGWGRLATQYFRESYMCVVKSPLWETQALVSSWYIRSRCTYVEHTHIQTHTHRQYFQLASLAASCSWLLAAFSFASFLSCTVAVFPDLSNRS